MHLNIVCKVEREDIQQSCSEEDIYNLKILFKIVQLSKDCTESWIAMRLIGLIA